MNRYYFTFGSSKNFPFQGGWVEVCAEDMGQAVKAFRAYYSDRSPGIINCASYYTEEEFLSNSDMTDGNLGAECHRIIGAFSLEMLNSTPGE